MRFCGDERSWLGILRSALARISAVTFIALLQSVYAQTLYQWQLALRFLEKIKDWWIAAKPTAGRRRKQ